MDRPVGVQYAVSWPLAVAAASAKQALVCAPLSLPLNELASAAGAPVFGGGVGLFRRAGLTDRRLLQSRRKGSSRGLDRDGGGSLELVHRRLTATGRGT